MSLDASEEDPRADNTRFEEIGRRAAADLRRPADAYRIEHVARTARLRRSAMATAIAGAAMVRVRRGIV